MILALDPSLNHIGWAIIEDGKVDDSGVINIKGDTLVEKLSTIRVELWTRFKGTGVADTVVEIPGKITYARSARGGKALNTDSMHKLCMATGVIIAELSRLGYEVETAVADEWKRNFSRRQFAAGKDFFLAAAKQITGREIKTDHEADAICLGWWWGKCKV